MGLKLANNATSTLAGDITAGATSLSVVSGDAGRFPTLVAGDWFPLTLVDAAGNLEIVRATARAGAVITVERAQEGTAAKAFATGARVDLRLTAAALSAVNAAFLGGKDLDYVTDVVARLGYTPVDAAGATISKTGAANYVKPLYVYAPELTDGQNAVLTFGRNQAAKNVAELQFNYVGDGSDQNALSFNLFGGTSKQFSIRADGAVLVSDHQVWHAGNFDPALKLDADAAYTGTQAAADISAALDTAVLRALANITDPDDAPLGSLTEFNSTRDAANAAGMPNIGSGAGHVWWNIFTYGAADRTTQIATEVFSHVSRTFIRVKHDATWYPWYEIHTNSGSIGVGGVSPGNTFDNGKAVAIGDNDTGLRSGGDGILEMWANNQQCVIIQSGVFTWKGNPITYRGILGSEIANVATAGAVGSYAFLRSTGTFTAGDVIAGSSLNWASDAYSEYGTTVSGTWRAMGTNPSGGGSSVFLRIA